MSWRGTRDSACEEIRPLLHRVAYGEAEPAEALRTERHVRDCTVCRILEARERRLASALADGLDGPLDPGEDFLQTVMDNLPQGPPPPSPRARRKAPRLEMARRLRLA